MQKFGVFPDCDIQAGSVSELFSEFPCLGKESFHLLQESQPLNVSCANGILICSSEKRWMEEIRLAADCHEQNCCFDLVEHAKAFRVQITKTVSKGEELRVWFSLALSLRFTLPILTTAHIKGASSYICVECGAIFSQPNYLKLHLLLKCDKLENWSLTPPGDESQLSFCSSSSNRVEEKRRRHVCVFCGKLYSRRYGLKIHVRTHTGYKPLQCRFCQRPFSDPSNLNKHVRLHVEINSPYKCFQCAKVLVRKRDLERHQRTRHPHLLIKDTL